MSLSIEEKVERTNKTKDIKVVQPDKDSEEYVFISYKSDDWKVVLVEIVQKLHISGLNVYFDKSFAETNDKWVKSMSDAITSPKCKGIIAFVSKEYLKSSACLMEILQPFTSESKTTWKNKLMGIIPVLLEGNSIDDCKCTEGKTNPKEYKEWNELFIDVYERALSEIEEENDKDFIIIRNAIKPMLNIGQRDAKKEVKLNLISNLMAEILNIYGNEKFYHKSDETFYSSLINTIKELNDSSCKVGKKVFRSINPEEKDINKSINDKVSLDEPEKVISYNAVNHKTAGVNEITTMPSPSASANDLRSKLIEKLGGDEVKSKAVFWIKDNKKFRLRSTTSTINNNKPNEQYDYLICEIKGKYGVFSSKQERDKIAAKDLDLNFDGLIEKIKEKLEEETKNRNRISPTTEVKDDENGTIEDDKESNATLIDLGKALNDYKHLAEMFLKTYEKRDPKRIECFTSDTVEKLKWEKDYHYWALQLQPQQFGRPDIIPEGELLTAIETLASNFRSNEKYLSNICLNNGSIFDSTNNDYEFDFKKNKNFWIKGVKSSKG